MIYTTNAIEALNSSLRRAVKIRGHIRLRGPSVPTDEAATKLIFLVLREVAKDWNRRSASANMPAREWIEAKSQFAILFEERFTIE